jgi:hypothetical protein
MLPLGAPASNSYQFMAFPLAILAAEKKAEGWIYSNFVQTCLDMDLKSSPVPYYYFIFDYTISPFLEALKLNREILELMHLEATAFIEGCIGLGYYIYLNVDEYYIPSRENTLKRHFSHDVMINGFDSEARALSIYGFTDRRRLECVNMEYAEFSKAYSSLREIEPDLLQVVLYRLNRDAEFSFDIGGFCEQLEEFLQGSNSSMRFRALRTPWERIYGIKAYDHLIEYIDECLCNSAKIEVKIFHFLYEHKKLMKDRLEFMLENAIISNRGILAEWKYVLECCQKVRNYILKSDVRGSGIKGADEIKGILSRLHNHEYSVLCELLSELKQNQHSTQQQSKHGIIS